MNSTALGFGIGIIIGIILFFVLVSIGWIDKLVEWIDKRFR
jgi:ABC-type nitrate/sulfonate/bicarbonate transport system permease component